MPSLTKIALPDAHIVNGNEFPVAYALEADDDFKASPEKVENFLLETAKTGFFKEKAATHGAVVLRGCGTTDPQIISRFIVAIGSGSGEEYFEQHGSTATRTIITDVLSTANEGPSENYIHQHNEFSRFTRYPSKLFFACTKYGPGTLGGETPIVHGAEFFNSVQKKAPKLIESLTKRGLLYKQVWANETATKTSWSDYFCFGREIKDDDELEIAKKKAEESVKSNVSPDFEWLEGNNLLVNQHTKPIRVHTDPITGKKNPTFFHSMATYYYQSKNKDYNTPTQPLMYDDGSDEVIDYDLLEILFQDAYSLSYNHSWAEGDIALVDNYQVSHGRVGWKNGPRTVLVSMWDDPKKQEYEVYTGA